MSDFFSSKAQTYLMAAEQNKNSVISSLSICFCFVQVQGFWLFPAKNLAPWVCGVCPQIQADSQTMHLKRQNRLVLPPGKVETAFPANAIRKSHLFSGHYLHGQSPNRSSILLRLGDFSAERLGFYDFNQPRIAFLFRKSTGIRQIRVAAPHAGKPDLPPKCSITVPAKKLPTGVEPWFKKE